jgi:enoyl-CoA hydratase
MNASFLCHELNHAHWAEIHEDGIPLAVESDGLPNWKDAPPVVPAQRSTVRAER